MSKYAVLTLFSSAYVPGNILDVMYAEGTKQSPSTHGAYILEGVGEEHLYFN